MKKLIILLSFAALMISWRSVAQGSSSKEVKTIEKFLVLPNNIKLEYVEQGNADGLPVIFLHGLSDSWHSFETVLANLPASIHAFAISQRGHGDSEGPLEGYTPKDFASDVAAFMKEKNIRSAFIVGHSMGGVNAQQFALNYPHMLKGLILVDTDPAFKDNPGMPEFYQQSLQLEGSMDRVFMDEFQKSTLSRPIDSVYYELLVDEGMKVPLHVFKQAFTGLMEVNYSNDLKKIMAPVLIMWGEKDTMTPRQAQDQFIKEIRKAKMIVYENTGHALHWQEPKRFADHLVAFITK
jgi:pimeloyl-ACP methyl ester carboxylesterase